MTIKDLTFVENENENPTIFGLIQLRSNAVVYLAADSVIRYFRPAGLDSLMEQEKKYPGKIEIATKIKTELDLNMEIRIHGP